MPANDKPTPEGMGRRTLMTAGAAGLAVGSIARSADAAKGTPKRGGTLRFGTTVDSTGLDPHRHLMFYVSNPAACTTQGLLDLNQNMDMVPGIAEEWDISKDLTRYTFRLRKGVEYHNGADVDAASVKWNYERILDPKIAYAFTRASLEDVDRIEVDGKHIVHIHMKAPSAVFLANTVFYPCNLMAPNSVDQADTHPIGCGPFKFVSWKRWAKAEFVRFPNYFETGADGKPLPYLDALEGHPKKEDKVRLTALRNGEVDLIDAFDLADAAGFRRDYKDKFTTWDVPQGGLAHLNLNAKSGPFAMTAPNGKLLRQAVAHAIDKEAIHQAIFSGMGEKAKSFFGKDSPWYMPGVRNEKEFDPQKSKAILRKLNMLNTPIAVVSRDAYPFMRNTAELLHSMLLEAGFKATNEVFDNPVLRDKYRKSDWGIDSTGSSFRFEPDGWYSRWLHSKGDEGQLRVGFANERVDKLIEEARVTLDRKKRLELYTEVDSIVNDEAALIYCHTVPVVTAATNRLKGYAPTIADVFTWSGGGIRTAYFE